MLCSISGHVPEDPVVSRKSCLLYERRLVEKEIQEHGVDPVTKEPTTLDDLLPVKTNKTVKPRPSSATSIPGLLGLFHNEWDALMLETHSLRQSLHTARQGLSHALYEHDAACRVIARLIQERDEARKALAEAERLVKEAGSRKGLVDDELEDRSKRPRPGIPSEVGQELHKLSLQLSKARTEARKKRVTSQNLASADDIGKYSLISSHPLHRTTQGGILAIALNPGLVDLVATAGVDATVQIFDKSSARILASIEEHTKRVNSVAWATPETLATASADCSVRVWRGFGTNLKPVVAFKDHDDEVVAVASGASEKYIVSASKDCTLGFYDLEIGRCYDKLKHDDVQSPYCCAQFHPDGLLIGSGSERGLIHIWEMRGQTIARTLDEPSGSHTSPVKGISFSENGYYMATAAADCFKLWDLRKLKVFREIKPFSRPCITCVSFDFSGLYLAVGGEDACVFGSKQDWNVVKTFSNMPKKGVYSMGFGQDAATVLVGASDHNLRIFGVGN